MKENYKNPGDLIRELIVERGWSQVELANMLGLAPATVNQVVNSKRPITPELAKLFAIAFDRMPEEFVEVQGRWDLFTLPEPNAEVRERVKLHEAFPFREMVKRGWLNEPSKIEGPYNALCRFFGVNSVEAIKSLPHAAKKTPSDEGIGSQLAWLYRVKAIAREMPTPQYDKAKLEKAIAQMSLMRGAPEETRHVAKLLHDAGVRFVIVEGLPGGRIDGVCFWLDAQSPVIGMSLRFDRIDNFWFVLRHECAHVLHGHGKTAAIIDNDINQSDTDVDEEEHVANTEASDFCVAREKMVSFYQRKKPLFSDIDIRSFAQIQHVHPGLVVGQLQHMSGQYKLGRQHLVGVRKHVTSTAIVDGWGDIIPTN
jgi:HTH-type transcriptional regulator/antitoxin HigA